MRAKLSNGDKGVSDHLVVVGLRSSHPRPGIFKHEQLDLSILPPTPRVIQLTRHLVWQFVVPVKMMEQLGVSHHFIFIIFLQFIKINPLKCEKFSRGRPRMTFC